MQGITRKQVIASVSYKDAIAAIDAKKAAEAPTQDEIDQAFLSEHFAVIDVK